MASENHIAFEFGKITKISSQIIFTEFYSNENFDLLQARKLDEARFKLVEGKEFYSLVNFVNVFGNMTKEAQLFFAKDSKCKDLIQHEILLVNSPPIRILAKYCMKWIKPPYKIEVTKFYEDGIKKLSALISI